MVSQYIHRFSHILQKEGPVEVSKKSYNFLNKQFRSRLHTYKNQLTNHIYFDAPAAAYAPIQIDPNNVEYLISHKPKTPIGEPHDGGFGQIADGEWPQETNIIRFDDYYIKVSFEQRFLDGKSWEKTTYYQSLTQSGKQNKQEAISKLNGIDRLYNSISEQGYEPGHSGANHNGRYGYWEQLEPFVVIGKDGEIYMWDGRHRFCIAQILDIEIPVHVVCRHKGWQKTRDSIHKNGLSKEHKKLRNHPDLQDVLN